MSAYFYIDGLTSSVSMEALIRLYSPCGTVLYIEILPDLQDESLLVARVQMESAEEADRAIQATNQTTLNGRVLTVYKESETNSTEVRNAHE